MVYEVVVMSSHSGWRPNRAPYCFPIRNVIYTYANPIGEIKNGR